ncbi:alkaline phosphatase [Methylobacterium aquaticum]|uniref:Alkaline phosphatase n=1 Tax=Methylobacterium aquaticum TaxID=270351 RepID=A0A0J6T1E7_9HYPH|nr:alkaline phosphatase [Methylobacterium aquaticum]
MVDWIVTAIERTGYLGVFLLMLIDNIFPPIPSEVIMPLAGFAAGRGQLSFIGVFLAGTAGSLSGTLLWYGVGRWLGRERLRRFAARHGRWLTLSPAEVERAGAWFARRGRVAVLLGRVVPGVRSLISVPAGVAGMPLTLFLAYSALGTIVWTGLLTAAGYGLGEEYRLVGRLIEPIGNGVLVLALVIYLYRVATFERGRDARG